MKINGMLSIEEFSKAIEELNKKKGIDYIDAVIHYCEKNNIELETAGAMIKTSTVLKTKVQREAENLNFLAKTSKLPI